MKTFLRWFFSAAVLMIGFPWLAVSFAGSAGMAVCFLLFYAVDPLFSAACGIAAGRNIRQLWMLPLVTAGLFLTGTWIFFEAGESAFRPYAGIYLAIGFAAMLIRAWICSRKQ